MTEFTHEPLTVVPFDRPQLIAQQVSRLAFMTELLQPDGMGEPGAYLLPADHDGDEKPETLELVLSEREAWRIYRDEVLQPQREAFLEDTPSGRAISGHLMIVNHLGEWANTIRQFEHLIPLFEEPEPDANTVSEWAIKHLNLDIENIYRATNFIDADDEAAAIVDNAIATIESAYRELQGDTLILMAVPELQIGHKDQALRLDEASEGTWRVESIMGNGSLLMRRANGTMPYPQRLVRIDDLLEWNNLHFVPDQASGVHAIPEESVKA